MDDQKKWIDSEIEKVVEQRRQMEDLEKVSGKSHICHIVKEIFKP